MQRDETLEYDPPKPHRGSRWLKGCGLGCGALLILFALALSLFWGGYKLMSDRAVATREALDAAYPSQSAFTPYMEEGIPEDRLSLFIQIRRELHPYCERFGEFQQSFRAVDKEAKKLDAMEEDPEARELLPLMKGMGSVFRSSLFLGRDLGEYATTRNEALMDRGIGLGEYTWIHVVAYHSWLGHQPSRFVSSEHEARIFYGRILGHVREMVRRKVQALEQNLEGLAEPDSASTRQALDRWRAELASMDSDPRRIPFQDGLPAGLEASLAPFRGELEALFCRATLELDLMHTEKHGLRYEHN